jgi:hypothetical protein
MEGFEKYNHLLGKGFAFVTYNQINGKKVGRHEFKIINKLGGDGRKYIDMKALTSYIYQNPHSYSFIFDEGMFDLYEEELRERRESGLVGLVKIE